MKVIRWGDHLVQLQRVGGIFPISCYLVRDGDGFTLLDTAISGSANGILAAARELGAPIRRIALTHPHVDHAGALDALHARLPDAEILISARDARVLRGDRSLLSTEPQPRVKGGWSRLSTHPTRELQDGDSVGSLRVVATPGHTPGSLSYYDPRDGSLVVGDALQTHPSLAIAGVIRWLFPFPSLATWDPPTAARSAAALLALHPTRIAAGHGPVLEHPIPALTAAVAEARRTAGLTD